MKQDKQSGVKIKTALYAGQSCFSYCDDRFPSRVNLHNTCMNGCEHGSRIASGKCGS